MAKQFTLGQGERLKSRKLIEQLFSEGKNFSSQSYRVYYLFSSHNHNSQFNIQFGVGVSAKNFKKAVNRNRVKRITREAYRIQKTGLQNKLNTNALQLNIFFIYTGKELPDFNTAKEKLAVILNRLIKIIDEKISSNS